VSHDLSDVTQWKMHLLFEGGIIISLMHGVLGAAYFKVVSTLGMSTWGAELQVPVLKLKWQA